MMKAFITIIVATMVTAVASAREPGLDRMVDRIRLGAVDFREASLTEVVQYLGQESRRLDTARQGLNIVVNNPAGKTRPITMSLRNVPLGEVLRYVAAAAGLQMRVERYAVVLDDPDIVTEPMVTRAYPIAPGSLPNLIALPEQPQGLRRPEDF